MKKTGAFSRLLSRSVVASIPIVTLFAVGSASPAAADASPPACDPASAAQITAVLTPDGHGTFTVGNSLPLCDPVPIGVAVYLKDADGLVFPQTLADSATDTIASDSKVLSVAIPQTGTSPHCFWQLDAFTGQPLPQITETERYADRLLAYLWGEVPTCAEVGAETETPPTTATPAPETETPPPSVEAVEVAPVETTTAPARPSVLARTGPKQRLEPLLGASGWLFIMGGSLLAWSSRRGQQLA